MKKVGAAFENFAFKAFDFNGRATLLEYWLLMPLVWGTILFLLYGDIVEFWGMLLQRRIPPLNPLYWDGILVFLLTFIPRLSLTVRRLHDSGKNGKWAKLPFVAIGSGMVLMLGLLSAVATSNVGGAGAAESLGLFAVVMAIAFGNMESVWDMMFATAAVLNAIGLDAIIAVFAEMTAPADQINVQRGIRNVANDFQSDPASSSTMLFMMAVFIGTPFITAMLHLFFMISPSKPDHALDSNTPMTGASLRKQGVTSDNPFAGYKHLYEKTPEQKAAAQATAKEEIRSLYQQRVLGSQQAS